ncbi:hypothetical protein HIM_09331 [Hirsutella minnesotensis 3608]|uniref:Trichodiene oxygenase n=1 Tax=Hirsutella minnesotensis 3608 TaxID=1043627 RepID=A0A0F7ZSF2_9HYPO|nr:hypothetical protein HIM_09331 [Hirsutella minnesotensis 3608]
MESVSRAFLCKAAAITAVICFITLAVYRLFFHPLARFPGPKLAAVTRWYEAYYDVVKDGQYTFQIAKMHKKYGEPYNRSSPSVTSPRRELNPSRQHQLILSNLGPIIRISPEELHINDSTYFEKLFRYEGRWNKYPWSIDAQNAHGAIIFTADHDQHKARRQPLNAYFSKARVASRQAIVRSKVDKLESRIADDFADIGRRVDVGAFISAFIRDVSTDFVLGKDYRSLDQDDFGVGMTHFVQGGGKMWRLTKHFPWYGPAMLSIPKDFLIKNADADTANYIRYAKASGEETERLLKAAASSPIDDDDAPTIVHEIVKSSLPPEDKTAKRVFADVATVTGAGFESTASVLRLLIYNVYSKPDILRRLRAELAQATSSNPTGDLNLAALEQLPYLTAVILEAMRLSPALGTRLQRIAPDRDLVYNQWVIPAGTPVGMTTIFMHMDERLYPRPQHFEPERWADPQAQKKAEKVYAPFSRGGRICLGMHLAWADMYFLVAALVQRFDFDFGNVPQNHFEFVSDQFIIGTRGKAILEGFVTHRKDGR